MGPPIPPIIGGPGPPIPVGWFGKGRPGGGPPDSYIFVIWSIKSCALSCPSAGGEWEVQRGSLGEVREVNEHA